MSININSMFTAPMFQVKIGTIRGFICPTCESITVGRYTQFLRDHGSHLSPLTPTSRERLFQKVTSQTPSQSPAVTQEEPATIRDENIIPSPIISQPGPSQSRKRLNSSGKLIFYYYKI